jgi:predicted nuclease of predicted toxin-antitoxin system
MNLSPAWVGFLKIHGIEAVHWSEVGDGSDPDTRLLRTAAERGWVVFTHDLDFGALLAGSGADRPSVIQIRGQDVLPDAIGESVVNAIRSSQSYLEMGALVTVDLARHRTRILPIR